MKTAELHLHRDIILASKRARRTEREKTMPIDGIISLAQMQRRPVYLELDRPALIAQIRLSQVYDPIMTALVCLDEGADGIAFFTDHTLYNRDYDDLALLAQAVTEAPIIFQNYVLDEYCVISARAAGASSVMLYADVLPEPMLRRVVTATQRWKMTVYLQAQTTEQFELGQTLSPQVVSYGDPLSRDVAGALSGLRAARRQLPYPRQVMLMPTLHTLDDVSAAVASGADGVFVSPALFKDAAEAAEMRRIVGRTTSG